MDVNNLSALMGLVLRVVTLIIILTLIPKQLEETRQPRDSFSRLRWYLLLLLFIVVVLLIPGAGRLYELISEHAGPRLAILSTVSTNLGLFALAVILRLIWTYKGGKK